MNERRKKTQEYICAKFKKLDPTGRESKRYADFFATLNDKQFDEFMQDIRDGKEVLVFYHANAQDECYLDQWKETAKELGVKLFERLKLWDMATQSYYLTPLEYMILDIPVRRMSQFQDHKLSVAEGDSKIDMLTGQVIKPDKAGSIAQTEVQALYAHGLTKTITELLKYRGGDITAFAEYKRELEETGQTIVSRDTHSVPRSAVTLDVLMSGMHIESNASGV